MMGATAAGMCVVVVTHESASTIDDCLARLCASTGVVQVRIVDNGSRDGTLAMLQRHALADPRIRFIGNPDNPGFSAACNQGAHDGDAPWLAFVNPDCMLEHDALGRLLGHARSRPGEAVVGADLVDAHGRRDGAARRRDPDFAAMLASPAARDLTVIADDSAALQPADAVSGALMLMPRALFERIGGFDEGYRLHAEDLDLCRRARQAGAEVLVANDVQVVHLRGVSSRSRPVFVEWHKHRGLWRYFRKFEASRRGLHARVAVFTMIWLRFPFAMARALLRA